MVVKILSMGGASGGAGAGAGAGGAAKDQASLYKILVLDRFTKDVIAPLLRVADLRKHGVTLHLTLEAERQPIPDVPAVYLVQPSTANLERIAADAAAGLYDVMHLHFTTTLPMRLMEQLAASAVKANAVARVGRLFDQVGRQMVGHALSVCLRCACLVATWTCVLRWVPAKVALRCAAPLAAHLSCCCPSPATLQQYLSFMSLENNLFSLGLPDTYVQLNDPTAQDQQIEVGSSSHDELVV